MKLNNIFSKGKSILLVFFLLSVSTVFSQEICDNGIDDDGDGLIDCLDPDCLSSPDCPAFAVPGGCLPIGYYPDIIGTETGYKIANQIADTPIPITTGSERITLVIQGVYQQGTIQSLSGSDDVNYGEERIVWGKVEIDIATQTSSGWVEYLSNNHDSRRFSWVDEALSTNMTSTYTTVGHDFGELTDFEFSFNHVGTDLIVGSSRPDVDISYFTLNYGNSATQSLTRIDGLDPTQYPVYMGTGTYAQTIDMLPAPDNPNYVIIRGFGINQNRQGSNGGLVSTTREESLAIKYIVCDLNTMTASGIMTVNGGNIPSMNTSLTFTNYDLTSGLPIVGNSTLGGDFAGNILPPNQITVSDMTIQVVGDQITITRSTVFGDDWNEMYYVEFLKYSNQPYSSSFFITQNAYSSPYDIGYSSAGVSGFVDFTIPSGSKRAYVEMRGNGCYSSLNLVGPTTTNSSITNDNQMYAFSEINLDLNESTGYYATLTTSTQQQIYAWQNVAFGQGNVNASPIYGQLPNGEERLDFELIGTNTLRVHLTNDIIAYERIIQTTFLGSKINLVYSSFDQNPSIFTGCDSVWFDMEICNSGGADLNQSVPISFYNGDPTTDPNAIYLQTQNYNVFINQGQCDTYTFGVDIASLGGATSGDITIVLNDNGDYSGTPGNQIPNTWPIDDLALQGNPVLECEFTQNIIAATWSQPIPANPPTVSFNQNVFVICPGDDATIIGTPANATGAVSYQWTPGGPADITNTITVNPAVETWYYLNFSDACFSDEIDSVKVELGNAEITNIATTPAQNCPQQGGAPVLGTISILPNNPTWTYTLGTLPAQNNGNFTGLAGGQSYLLSIVGDNGCTSDTIISISIDAAVAVTADWLDASLAHIDCFGDGNGAAAFNNIQGGLTQPYDITWLNTTDNTLIGPNQIVANGQGAVNTLSGGNWIVTATDQSGCSWSHVFEIIEPDELIVDLSSNNSPSCFDLADGSLNASISGGNDITDGIGSVTISNSANTVLNSGNSDLTINNLVSDTYTVVVVDDKGCTTTESVTLINPDEIAIDFTITNPNCYGVESGSIVIDTVYNYQSPAYFDSIYYDWNPAPYGGNGYNSNENNFIGEGNYILKLTDDRNCIKFFDFDIEYPDSIYFSQLDFESAVCRNQVPFDNGSGQVYAAASGGSNGNGAGTNFTYVWEENQTAQTTTASTWGNRNPGYYIILATNDLGCFIEQMIYLDSLSPEAIFNMTLTSDHPPLNSPNEGTAIIDIELINQSTNYNFANLGLPYGNDPTVDTNFIWTFGLLDQVPTEIETDHDNINEIVTKQYLSEGVYEVCLIVTENMNGCVDTVCQQLIVHDVPDLLTPNVFTPGGNGQNDFYYFSGQGVSQFSCQVFNSWGNQVFEFTDVNDTWNGENMNTNSPCVDGTYFYIYNVTYSNGMQDQGQGNIQIIND
jgi:gliding motility-associated-like protein